MSCGATRNNSLRHQRLSYELSPIRPLAAPPMISGPGGKPVPNAFGKGWGEGATLRAELRT